jgi:carboxypeptidase family protein
MRKQAAVALVVVLICCVQTAGAGLQTQVGIVRGRVVDVRGAPVIRIKVTIGALWGYSDTTGRYLFSRVPFGTYKVTLERDGRKVVKPQIDVRKPINDVPDLRWP